MFPAPSDGGRPQLRSVAHCDNSLSVTKHTHHVVPVSLAARDLSSLCLMLAEATSVSSTTYDAMIQA